MDHAAMSRGPWRARPPLCEPVLGGFEGGVTPAETAFANSQAVRRLRGSKRADPHVQVIAIGLARRYEPGSCRETPTGAPHLDESSVRFSIRHQQPVIHQWPVGLLTCPTF